MELAYEIPRTSAGKFLKSALREKYQQFYMQNGENPACAVKAAGK